MALSKTSDHIQTKIKMSNPSQEPPASSKALNKDLKEDLNDMDVLFTFKIEIKMQNPNLRQTKYSTKAELLWPNLRQIKNLKKAELVSANPSWAELPDLRLICAELSLLLILINAMSAKAQTLLKA